MNSNTDNSTTDSEGWNSVTKNTKKSKKSEDKSKLIETSEKKSSTYSSIVKGNSVTTSNKEASTSDKEASTSDKEVSTTDKEVTTDDKEVTTADKEVTTADKEVTTADKEASTSDSGSSSNLSNTKRFAKASAPINIKVNFTKRENPKNNLKDNNIEYKKALIIASQTFFNECLINNKDFIEKEKIKISKFYNYKNTVHKVSYAKDFDSQKIGTQTIAFSRSHFAHNETFIKKLIIEYKNIFPECDWVKIKDSTRDDEPDTLIISIGRTIKLKN